jgi:hypothetical protein
LINARSVETLTTDQRTRVLFLGRAKYGGREFGEAAVRFLATSNAGAI